MLQSSYKNKELYQQALLLSKELYFLTQNFPDAERTMLTYTLRRLSVSLCQNLATALVKRRRKQKRGFKSCINDCIVLDTQLDVAQTVGLCTAEQAATATTILNKIYKNLQLALK